MNKTKISDLPKEVSQYLNEKYDDYLGENTEIFYRNDWITTGVAGSDYTKIVFKIESKYYSWMYERYEESDKIYEFDDYVVEVIPVEKTIVEYEVVYG